MLEAVHELVLVEAPLHLEALHLDVAERLLQEFLLLVERRHRLRWGGVWDWIGNEALPRFTDLSVTVAYHYPACLVLVWTVDV